MSLGGFPVRAQVRAVVVGVAELADFQDAHGGLGNCRSIHLSYGAMHSYSALYGQFTTVRRFCAEPEHVHRRSDVAVGQVGIAHSHRERGVAEDFLERRQVAGRR